MTPREVYEQSRVARMDAEEWLYHVSIPQAEAKRQALVNLARTWGWDVRIGGHSTIVNRWVQQSRTPGKPMALTDHANRVIQVNEELPVSAQVYLLVHEMAHTTHGQVSAPTWEVEALRSGLITERQVRAIRVAEAIAEGATAQVLQAWHVEPNWEYFRNWKLSEEELAEAWPQARGAARAILEEVV